MEVTKLVMFSLSTDSVLANRWGKRAISVTFRDFPSKESQFTPSVEAEDRKAGKPA
jgi:hypothetical protein